MMVLSFRLPAAPYGGRQCWRLWILQTQHHCIMANQLRDNAIESERKTWWQQQQAPTKGRRGLRCFNSTVRYWTGMTCHDPTMIFVCTVGSPQNKMTGAQRHLNSSESGASALPRRCTILRGNRGQLDTRVSWCGYSRDRDFDSRNDRTTTWKMKIGQGVHLWT